MGREHCRDFSQSFLKPKLKQAKGFSRFLTVSSHKFNSQNFKLRVSNPRTIAYFHFKMLFESSDLPGAGQFFPVELKIGRSRKTVYLPNFTHPMPTRRRCEQGGTASVFERVPLPEKDCTPRLGNVTSQDLDTCLRSVSADSSSPRISAILVGNFTGKRDSLRKTFIRLAQTNVKILAREIPFSGKCCFFWARVSFQAVKDEPRCCSYDLFTCDF